MIRGTVVVSQACVSVTFRLAHPPNLALEFVIDTGFEGALTLPPAAVKAMGLPYFAKIQAHLADAQRVATHVYRATIMWHGQDLEVAVIAMGKRPLLGTALLTGSYLGVDFRDGGEVRIDPRP